MERAIESLVYATLLLGSALSYMLIEAYRYLTEKKKQNKLPNNHELLNELESAKNF